MRVLAIASIGAVAAVAAHGGPALATDPRWLLPALAAALACTWAAAGATRLASHGAAARPLPLWAIAGLLLAAQTAAHLALIRIGVMPAGGQSGAIALHLLLALLGALLWATTECALAGRAERVRRAWLEFGGGGTPPPPCPGRRPRPVAARAVRHLRGPPRG